MSLLADVWTERQTTIAGSTHQEKMALLETRFPRDSFGSWPTVSGGEANSSIDCTYDADFPQ